MPRVTMQDRINELEHSVELERAGIVGLRNQANEAKRALAEAIAIRDDQHRQIVDLQERLAAALSEGDRMRGYIARVQEDDVAREELVTTGDPAGEQVLEPKRRPTQFARPGDCSALGEVDEHDRMMRGYSHDREPRRKPLHWIRYGR